MASLPPSEKPLGTDEKLARTERVLTGTNGDSHNLPTHVQNSDSGNVELETDKSMTRAAWDRFNGHGRKHVGFFQSVKAVVFCSCTFNPTASSRSWNLLRIPRFERVVDFPSIRLGFPLRPLGRQDDFCMCVPSLGSGFTARLLIGVVFGVSMLPLYHSFGETLRLVWRPNDVIPRTDLG
jgi:hypothetical protein